METMTKKEKFKKFMHDHRETIAKVTVYTTLIAGSIAIIAKAISEQEQREEAVAQHNSWAEEENVWLDEQKADGKAVYLLHDWTYLLVPKDTETEWVKERNPSPLKPNQV